MAIPSVVSRTGTDKIVKPLYSAGSAFSFPAAVAIVNKQSFKNRADVIINEVMDYPVPEIGGENFSLHRLENYKTDTWTNFICSIFYFLVKLKQFTLVIYFKVQDVNGVSFVLACVKIGLKQIV